MKMTPIPCPDCGASAEVKQATYSGMMLTYSYVHCTNPSCHLHRHTLHFTAATPVESDRRAIESWNERYAGTLSVSQLPIREMPAQRCALLSPMNGAHA